MLEHALFPKQKRTNVVTIPKLIYGNFILSDVTYFTKNTDLIYS